jgi:hypothetical protein
MSGGGTITWRSKKQTTIALSSTEAEYVALSKAGREVCWLRNLYEELGQKQQRPTVIKGDNDSSITMARNPQFHKQSKHIDLSSYYQGFSNLYGFFQGLPQVRVQVAYFYPSLTLTRGAGFVGIEGFVCGF